MHRKQASLISLPVICLLFIIVSFPMNEWFCETMPRHQLLQLPAMLFLGVITGVIFRKISIGDIAWGICILIITMFSIIFWMLPHSIDAAVINTWFNRAMHLNMLAAGFFLVLVFREIIFEIRIAFLWMMSAMLLATGITLKYFDILLCSSFTIAQQNETGYYLLLSGSGLFLATMIFFFHGLGRKELNSASVATG